MSVTQLLAAILAAAGLPEKVNAVQEEKSVAPTISEAFELRTLTATAVPVGSDAVYETLPKVLLWPVSKIDDVNVPEAG